MLVPVGADRSHRPGVAVGPGVLPADRVGVQFRRVEHRRERARLPDAHRQAVAQARGGPRPRQRGVEAHHLHRAAPVRGRQRGVIARRLRDRLAPRLDRVPPVGRQLSVRQRRDHRLGVVEQRIAGDERRPRVRPERVERLAGVAAEEEVRRERVGVGDDAGGTRIEGFRGGVARGVAVPPVGRRSHVVERAPHVSLVAVAVERGRAFEQVGEGHARCWAPRAYPPCDRGALAPAPGIIVRRVEGAGVTDRLPADPTVAVPQVPVDDLRVDENVDRLRHRAADLPPAVDLAAFPEYALTGFAADERLREAALSRDAARARLESVAEAADAAVIAGYAERDGESVYNATAYVPPPDRAARDDPGTAEIDDCGEFSVYRKRHLWGEEDERVEPGTDRVVVETPVGSTGLLTCYDLNFVAESAWFAERAVDALAVVGAWPADHVANWRLLCRARALDGVRWVVGAGRTGTAGGGRAADEATYAGNSLVARPDGAVAAELAREPATLTATLDRDTLSAQRDLVGSVGDT